MPRQPAPIPPARSRRDSRPATGRVVATITTLDGTVQMPGVAGRAAHFVRRDRHREDDDRRRRAWSRFPDVPPGRYIIKATRPGFISNRFRRRSRSAPAKSRRCLLDIKLTFVMPEIEVRAETPSPTDSVQPVSMSDMLAGSVFELAPLEGDDFQSLLLLLPGVVRGPDGRLRIKGGQPTPGRAAGQQRQPERSVVRRFRSRAARAERRIGRSARQSVRRGIRPLFDERHADSHAARHQRLGDQARQSHAAIPRVVQRHARIRAALLGARPAQARPRVPRAGLAVPLRRDAGQEPARRAGDHAEELRFLHARRRRDLRATHPRRRPDRVSARDQAARR